MLEGNRCCVSGNWCNHTGKTHENVTYCRAQFNSCIVLCSLFTLILIFYEHRSTSSLSIEQNIIELYD